MRDGGDLRRERHVVKVKAKRIFIGLVVVVALLQLVQPDRVNPAVEPARDWLASNAPPARVVGSLRAACYDCHSNETKWPWYSRVSPVSWWIVDHIKDGRKHLNFSDWPHDNPRKARSRWQNIQDEIESGGMPLKSYTLIHSEARLSATDRTELMEWVDSEVIRLNQLMGESDGK